MDTINMKTLRDGRLIIKRIGFVRILNKKCDTSSFGTGIGQARNYEKTLLKELQLNKSYLINGWMSQSYDNAVHHDRVPELTVKLFDLPAFHTAIRDPNHNINIAT